MNNKISLFLIRPQNISKNKRYFYRAGRRLCSSLLVGAAAATTFEYSSRADVNWDGDNTAGYFSYCGNWYGSCSNPGGDQGCCPSWSGTLGTLHFSFKNNAGQLTQYYDLGTWNDVGDILWDTTWPVDTTWNGNGNGLHFNQRLENDSSHVITIGSMKLTGAYSGASHIELNPVNGDLIINGNLYNDNTKPYQVYGGNAKMLTIASGLGYNATPTNVSFTIEQYSKVKFTAAQSWGSSSVGTSINTGELWMDAGGSLLAGSPVTLGLSDTNVAKLYLSVATGGQTFANPITLNSSSGTAQKTIGGLNNSGNNKFTSAIALNGQADLEAATGGSVEFNGVISGSGQNVVINGYGASAAGTVIYSAAQTYSGSTYISGGTLQLNAGGTINAGAGAIYLGETSGSSSAAFTLGVTGGGQTVANPLTVRSGSSGTKTVSSLVAAAATNTYSGNISLQTALNLQSAGGVLNLNGVVSENAVGAGSVSAAAGNAGIISLNGANTFTGGTIVKAGTLLFSGGSSSTTSGPLGPSNSVVLLGDTTGTAGATLTHSGSAAVHFYPLTIRAGSSGIKTLADVSATSVNYSSNIVLNDSVTLGSGASGKIILSGPVSGTGGLLKTNSGIALLSASGNANTFTGNITISMGTFQVGSSSAIPSGSGKGIVTLNPTAPNTALFDLNGNNQTINSLASSGMGSAVVDNSSGSSKILTVGTAGSNPDGTFGGVIQNSYAGTVSLTKSGKGMLTLTGTNTYNGATTINAGTLTLGSNGSISNSSSLALAAGATFDVSAIHNFHLSSSTSLSASGTGVTVGTAAAAINGAVGGSINLGSQPLTLTYDGSHPALFVEQGTLVLNGNSITVNGLPLAVGTYPLIQQAAGNITSSGNYSVSGTAIGTGKTGVIAVSGGFVNLMVQNPTTTLLARHAGTGSSTTYGDGLSFDVSVSPTSASGTVVINDGGVGGVTLGSGTLVSGVCTITLTANALAAGTHANLVAVYAGDSSNAGSFSAALSTQTVAQKTLTPGLTGAVGKVYDGTVAAALAAGNYNLFGALGGDTVNLNNPVSGTYDTKNFGTGKLVSVTGLALAGSSAANYSLASTSVSATVGTIAKTNLTISAAANTKTYDGTTNAAAQPTITAGSIQAGDSAPAWTESYSTSSAGTGKTLTPAGVVNDGNSGNNYNYTYVTSTAGVINPASTSVALASRKNPAGFKDTIFFNASSLPADATGSLIFKTNAVFFDTESLSSGTATSVALSNLPRGADSITLEYAGDGNYLGSTNSLTQTITNHPPVVGAANYLRAPGVGLKIHVSNLVTNATDADGDTLAFLANDAASANGVTLADGGSGNSTIIVYPSSATNLSDAFQYSVSDGFGGTVTGTVTISIDPTVTGQQASINVMSGTATMTFYGLAGYHYAVQRSLDGLSNWTDILVTSAGNAVDNTGGFSVITAPAAGAFTVVDSLVSNGSVFYRLRAAP